MLKQIIEKYPDENFLVADGFDEAIIGVEESSMRLIYSVNSCLTKLCFDMTMDEAIEHFEFNIKGSYLGEKTPIWCEDTNSY